MLCIGKSIVGRLLSGLPRQPASSHQSTGLSVAPKRWCIAGHVASAVLTFLCVCVTHADIAGALTNPQRVFLEAIRTGDIQRARELQDLGGLDATNFDGKPFVKALVEIGGWPTLLSDEAFDYTFKELKQDFNTRASFNDATTVFAFMCVNAAPQIPNLSRADALKRTIERTRFALTNGANPNALTGIDQAQREVQPFPRCAEAYTQLQGEAALKPLMLELLDLLLSHGADPNYAQPIGRAAARYDIDLFKLLRRHGAHIDNVFPVPETFQCKKRNRPNNTILALLPSPKDAEVDRARDFIKLLIDEGADIRTPQHYVWITGTNCIEKDLTLFDRALESSQLSYARMVREMLAHLPATQDNHTTTPAKSQVSAGGLIPGNVRVSTSRINVRAAPTKDAPLHVTLASNMEMTIERSSGDGEWTFIEVTGEVAGWVHTPVLLKNSRVAEFAAPGSAAAPSPPPPSPSKTEETCSACKSTAIKDRCATQYAIAITPGFDGVEGHARRRDMLQACLQKVCMPACP